MLNLEVRKTLCTALIQCSFDYSCCSWYPGINETFKKKLQVMQNKMVRFILKLDSRAHIGNDELVEEREEAGAGLNHRSLYYRR